VQLQSALTSGFRVWGAVGDADYFAYRVSGEEGFVFFPHSRLNTKHWFQQLLQINPNLSLGLQVVHDAVVLAGLRKEYESAKAWQDGR